MHNHLTDKYVGHNDHNYGNYLWEASANALEVSLPVARMGAHVNNRFFDGTHKGTWDSKDDQLSIVLGWTWRNEGVSMNKKEK
mgnify:CR=1 FL=1